MNPETPRNPLAEQPWFVAYLASKGFEKTSPTTFVRGEASIHVEGSEFHADPGNGDKGLSTDFGDAANRFRAVAVRKEGPRLHPEPSRG